MDRESARQEIRARWREFYQKDGKGKGIICPICNSGGGKNGTGISENPRKPGNLHCWKCGFSGDVIDLLQQERGIDYNSALQEAAGQLGLYIEPYRPQGTPQERHTGHKSGENVKGGEIYRPATENATEGKTGGTGAAKTDFTEYYRQCRERITEPAAAAYLQARGISADTAAAYWIGFDPEADPANAPGGNGEIKHPCPRMIIPTSTAHYIARRTDGRQEYRAMNPGGSRPAIFNLRSLYDGSKTVFVTEGAFDALAIIESGAAAIALNSTSNADALIKTLEEKRTGAILILALDNDDAGRRAAGTIKEGLQRLNVSYTVSDISAGYKDPNAALTADPETFAATVQAAQAQAIKPENVTAYIDLLMSGEIAKFREAQDRKTGFSNLDREAGGLYTGLYCIAATSSLGKTTFANQMADQLAAAGNDVIFFSMEQSRLELVSKSLARMAAQKDPETPATSLSIRKGILPPAVLDAADEYKAAIADRLSIVEGNFSCNVSFIGEYVREYIKRTGCKPIVFIDYLQILQPADDRHQSTKEAIDSAVTELKRMSRENDITVFIISSVNRANYLTPIDFESLKESGGIEYTCDVIWGLQLQCLNEDVFSQDKKIKEKRERIKEAKRETPRKIELVCLKNRYGIANFSVAFDYFPRNDLFTAADDFRPLGAETSPFESLPIQRI